MQIRVKRAFTLIEILVVIFILMLVYSLIVVTFNTPQNSTKINITNLKNYLIKQNPNSEIDFVCLNSCEKCYEVSEEVKEIEEKPLLDSHIEVYSFDIYSNPIRKGFVKFEDNQVCFRYKISKRGVSEPLIIKNFNKYYYLPSYFGEVLEFEDLSDAKEFYFRSNYPLGDIY